MTDREAVEKLQQGGRERAAAVAYLYRRYAPRFLGYFLRHRLARRDADGVVQEAFVRIVRDANGFPGDARIDAWIWASARAALLEHFRSRHPQEVLDDHDLALLVERETPPVLPPPANLDECVRRACWAFASAHADRAEMVARVAFDGWSMNDVATALGRSPVAAQAYLAECRGRLSAFIAALVRRHPGVSGRVPGEPEPVAGAVPKRMARRVPRGAVSERDDQDWLDALAGAPPSIDAEPAVLTEAALVRRALLASRGEQRPPRLDVDAGVRRLVGRLQEEKLLEKPSLARIGWKIPAAGATLALAIAFVIAFTHQPEKRQEPRSAVPEIPVRKGNADTPQVIVTPEARDLAEELKETMSRHGLAPTISGSGSITRFEADWPKRPQEKHLEFLRMYRLEQPGGPRLQIEVRLESG